MDATDTEIVFDDQGVCNHCLAFDLYGRPILERAASETGKQLLERLIDEIRLSGRGRDYDCVIGISGGVDSSFAAYQVKRLGLRPLAVHFDSGWNSELAVNNIENIIKRLDFDLFTFVADWEEMRDLQLAFFKASLANCDIPTDHGFLAVLYRVAAQHGIKHVISGGNAATEFILPKSWGYNAGDLRHLHSVHRRFGSVPLRNYPRLGFWSRYLYFPLLRGIKTVRLLDYMPYNKAEAKRLIAAELGWRDYGGKHYESIFTRFFQAYYLPTKFGYDKRRAHLSSLIVSGQMTREEALAELDEDPYPSDRLLEDKVFVAKKLGVSIDEFDRILALPKRTHKDFASNELLFRGKDQLMHIYRKFRLRD
jgi:N-acetyl sugar amidotransferase